ncbi:MAG: molybdopterin-dependent oxidoreductase [Burkholderiaceae bacterium]
MLTKKTATATVAQGRLARAVAGMQGKTIDRRTFLKRSGVTAGAAAFASQLPYGVIQEASAADPAAAKGEEGVVVRRTVCSHCSVGCSTDAVVKNGVWVRQEPVFESPLNMGGHCAKGAALREHGMTEHSHRLKYPMKLVNGKYQRISWDEALDAISKKMQKLREESGPDSLFFLGGSKQSNEQNVLIRKFVSFWGTNNCDQNARICHSTTVAGVANTWGYGSMTNSYNDMMNAKAIMYIGSNAAEAHPVSMVFTMNAKEHGAKVIVVDPRFTRTAAKADQFVRLRVGSDIPFLHGVMWHIFKNGWEDKAYLKARVYGVDQLRAEVNKWTPEKVTEVTGVPEEQVRLVAETMAQNRPSTLVWCMGQTQHTIGNSIVRASCLLQLVLGNVGVSGGGTNIFRGHDNVQGATDLGGNPDSLPGYYGIAPGAWKHWADVWNVDLNWIKSRFASEALMTRPGITLSRWFDAVMEPAEVQNQPSKIRGVFFLGMAPNSQTRGVDQKPAMDALDLLVVMDPYPTATAMMAAMPAKDGAKVNPNREVYLLPTATQFETYGSVTASNRSVQWREQVIAPLFESHPDHAILYRLAEKLGYADQFLGKRNGTQTVGLVKGAGGWDEPNLEDVLRNEINKGVWTIGYSGHSPERLKLHMKHMGTFDVRTLKANGGPCDGDFFGLPWPCWGTPEMKHPGTPNQYDTSKTAMEGGGNFRANFGVERDGVSLLAEDGSHCKGADITTGYPEFDSVFVKKLGWWGELTADEQKAAEGKNWKTDLSGGLIRVVMKNHGCLPYGNAKARAVVWNFPDPIPVHREPLFSNRPDLVAKYPTYADRKDFWRLPTLYKTVQDKNVADKVHEKFPLVMTSGRLVEYEGGGEETRSNPWLAELQQHMFVEINPKTANDRGIRNGDMVWVSSPNNAKAKVMALVTERVGTDTVFLPFHFAGHWQGQDMLGYYPEGAAPLVRGDSVNTIATYGYDSVTMMQEGTKASLCQIAKA